MLDQSLTRTYAAATNAAAAPARLASIDQLRGLVMVLMALDHTRDFFSSALFDPLDLTRTDPALFLTRWVTHFCAPTFVLLAGVSAYVYGARGRSRGQLARFLFTRGLWLILLELTVVRFGWYFFDRQGFFLAQVIWVIGWSLIVLAGLVWLPIWAVGTFGLTLVAGHDWLDHTSAFQLGLPAWLWTVLHQTGSVRPWPGIQLQILYPLVPWIGVMAVGYALGPLFQRPAAERFRWLLGLGAAATAAFFVLRLPNGYGDPHPWAAQLTSLFTVFSFFNVEKYPPSLLFILVTLGPALVALAALERWAGAGARRVGGRLAVFGRVPLLYYVIHLILLHALALVLVQWRGLRGFSLPQVYLIWLAVVVSLYPVCRWFSGLKQRHTAWWLSYI